MRDNIIDFNTREKDEALVKISKLHKEFGSVVALENIDLEIPRGEIIGLLGPNGSGKSTLFKILAGLYNNYSGQALIEGKRPSAESKAIVSYLPDKPVFNMKETPENLMDLYETFFEDFSRNRAEAMLKSFDINIFNTLGEMSKGMIDKVQLSLVMARQAKLYLLDEPLGGVDVAARDVVLDTILDNYNKEGTIIVTTHLIGQIERLFDRVVVLKYGNIVANDNCENIKSRYNLSLEGAMKEMFLDEKIK